MHAHTWLPANRPIYVGRQKVLYILLVKCIKKLTSVLRLGLALFTSQMVLFNSMRAAKGVSDYLA